MARGGINKALVQKARRAILTRGEHASIDAVRVELGNTGSRTTIHRYLKELEEAERGRSEAAIPLSGQLTNLVAQMAEQLAEEAQAAVAEEREQLARERRDYHERIHHAESRSQQFEAQCTALAEKLQALEQSLQQEQQQRQQADVEKARLRQANGDLETRVQDRDGQIRSLEEKHQHARDALEHYRQASKEQREQEQRRHEAQVQQLQMELRQLQQTLMIKQDELTQLNRDNARLLTEIRQEQRERHSQEKLLAQTNQALANAERTNAILEQRLEALQVEANSLRDASTEQILQAQSLKERLIEVTTQLKLLEQPSSPQLGPGRGTS
ncbi:DNA-binding protein [Pseudomonas sp. PI1]|uniref:DNA-binding protein n=1 Tax=Pseudomonas sp. PI1 TaxID=1582493 RepID=UPI0005B8EF70|nr:DNA-binding protein [Pseudomonas sp. PI1]KWR85199.1 cointegrate resolution protein T [Pseudomonas sp. PI1]